MSMGSLGVAASIITAEVCSRKTQDALEDDIFARRLQNPLQRNFSSRLVTK